MTNYNNACSSLSPTQLSRYIADPSDTQTGYQSWLVSRVYAALKRCASQHSEYPSHNQLIYMVVDCVARFSVKPWLETRSGRGRKASEYNTPCLHCAECTERQQDIDYTLRATAKDCLHPVAISISAKAGKPLPHDLKTWRNALLNQCYDSGYIKARGWLASDERPAAIDYMSSYRSVERVQSLRPLDIISAIHTEHDKHPELVRLAEAQLNMLVDADDLAIANLRHAQTAPEFKANGTKCHDNGTPYQVGENAVAKLAGKSRRQVKASLAKLAEVMTGDHHLPDRQRKTKSMTPRIAPNPTRPAPIHEHGSLGYIPEMTSNMESEDGWRIRGMSDPAELQESVDRRLAALARMMREYDAIADAPSE